MLVDSRIEPQKRDLDFMSNLGERGLPFVIVFTKTEKLSGPKLQATIDTYRATLLEEWEEMPQFLHHVGHDQCRSRRNLVVYPAAK